MIFLCGMVRGNSCNSFDCPRMMAKRLLVLEILFNLLLYRYLLGNHGVQHCSLINDELSIGMLVYTAGWPKAISHCHRDIPQIQLRYPNMAMRNRWISHTHAHLHGKIICRTWGIFKTSIAMFDSQSQKWTWPRHLSLDENFVATLRSWGATGCCWVSQHGTWNYWFPL